MKEKELKFLLQEGEGLKIEFKESFDSKSLAKDIVAFANSEGGRIFLGVSDDSKARGILITNKLKSQIQDLARNCDPQINIKIGEFNNIIIINIHEGDDKPYKCSSGFYLRQGPNSQKMKRDDIIRLIAEVGKLKFDEQANRKFKFPQDFDKEKFLEFIKRSNISKLASTKEVLTNLSLGNTVNRKFTLNNAGVLLFAKEPEKFFRQNFVTCVLYKGKEKVDIIDRKDFKEDLLSNYEDTFAFLKQHLKLEYEIKGYGPRKEIPEIPYEALREAIINALIHRDYFEDRFGIFVEIFDDRVEITNKGKLLFDRRKLGKISMPRNPVLFGIFHRLNLIEKVGSGINRIKRQVKERGLKVKFETDEFFRVVFYRPKALMKTVEKTVERLGERLGEGLGENQKKILILVSTNKFTSIPKLSKELKISTTAIENNIAKLKEKGLLKRVGPAKGGYWKLKKEAR